MPPPGGGLEQEAISAALLSAMFHSAVTRTDLRIASKETD